MLKLTYFLTIVLLGKQIGFLSQPQPPNGVEALVLNTDFDSFNLSRSLLLYCSHDFSQETKLPKACLLPSGRTH